MTEHTHLLHRLTRLRRVRHLEAARALCDRRAAVDQVRHQIAALDALADGDKPEGTPAPGALLARHRLSTVLAQQAHLAADRRDRLLRETETARAQLAFAEVRMRVAEDRLASERSAIEIDP